MEKLLKPCGYIDSQGQRYLLLHPTPLPRDSQWNDGTYMFFVAFNQGNGRYDAGHIITNAFCLGYDDDAPPIYVHNITDEEEKLTLNEPWDNDLSDDYPEELAVSVPEPIEEELPF